MANYNTPEAPVVENPINLDKAITDIQLGLATIPWLKTSYGRVYKRATGEINEEVKEEPHVYAGNGEYKKVLANDNFQSHSFIYVIPPERIIDWEPNQKTQTKEVDIAIIFWVDLRKIDPSRNEVFLETLKSDIEGVLNFSGPIQTINRIYDDNVKEVFKEFDVDEMNKELLMYPFKAIRYECQISYETFCE